jgi:hypothetical protein
MRANLLLSALALTSIGCAVEDPDLVSAPLVSGLGQHLEARELDLPPMVKDLAPYAGANWDFRVEIGLVDGDDPDLAVYPARAACLISGDWKGLPPQGWDEPVTVSDSKRERWAPIWQGTLPSGHLQGLVIDLDSEVHVVDGDLAYDAELASANRRMEVALNLDTATPDPLVVTILVETVYNGGQVNLEVADVLVRKVDEQGYPID